MERPGLPTDGRSEAAIIAVRARSPLSSALNKLFRAHNLAVHRPGNQRVFLDVALLDAGNGHVIDLESPAKRSFVIGFSFGKIRQRTNSVPCAVIRSRCVRMTLYTVEAPS